MSQQTTWRCADCDDIVTACSEDGRHSPSCPICGTPKDAAAAPAREARKAESYDTRAGSRFAETAGPELDRLLARRVLGGEGEAPAPPYSSEDLAATALAELVGRQSDWSFHLAFCGSAWMATFTQKSDPKEPPSPPVATLVSASGRSRALAICRALLKVTRCPRWSPLGSKFLGEAPASNPPTRSAGCDSLSERTGLLTP
jgi:hypothetical protein